jgi:hypothetical protein
MSGCEPQDYWRLQVAETRIISEWPPSVDTDWYYDASSNILSKSIALFAGFIGAFCFSLCVTDAPAGVRSTRRPQSNARLGLLNTFGLDFWISD